MTDEQLSTLLRLKRYEQPPAQYFDRLLQDIHRRQRTELLRRPLWKIAAERMQTFFSEHSMGNLSYAGALAAVLVVGVSAIGLMTPSASTVSFAPSMELANATPLAPIAPTAPVANSSLLTLQTTKPQPVFESPSLPSAQSGYESAFSQPRYIIDARPASYEPSSSFNF
jgi:hypothetical protein